jgi:hypothetical protein
VNLGPLTAGVDTWRAPIAPGGPSGRNWRTRSYDDSYDFELPNSRKPANLPGRDENLGLGPAPESE